MKIRAFRGKVTLNMKEDDIVDYRDENEELDGNNVDIDNRLYSIQDRLKALCNRYQQFVTIISISYT